MNETPPTGATLSYRPDVPPASKRGLLITLGILALFLLLISIGVYHRIWPAQTTTERTIKPETTGGGRVGEDVAKSLDGNQPSTTPTPAPTDTAATSESGAEQTPPPGTVTPPSLSPREQARLEAYQEEQRLLTEPVPPMTLWQQPKAQVSGVPSATLADPITEEAKLLQALATKSNAPAMAPAPQEAKPRLSDPLFMERTPPPGAFTIRPGTYIHAAVTVAVSSEIEGEVIARIDEPVYDDKKHLLIPQNTMIIGEQSSRFAYGNSRLLQVWSLLVYPDGSSTELPGLHSYGADGASGIKANVNEHVGRLIRDAAIVTAFSAGVALTQRQNATIIGTPTVSATIGQAVGQGIGQLGTEVTRRNLELAPTAELKPGESFRLLISRYIVFPGPYESTRF